MTPPSGNTPEHPKAGEHTPTPWKRCNSDRAEDGFQFEIFGPNDEIVALIHGTDGDLDDANSHLIVCAVNNYEALRARNAKLVEAASKWSRCCDLWQDDLGGMHCTECSQKTFAMLYEIQKILGISKGGNARTESENAHE